MPIREPQLRDGTDQGTSTTPLTKGYRSFDFADVLSLHILETRLLARDQQLAYPTAASVQTRIAQILSSPTEIAAYAATYKVTAPTSTADAARFGAAIASFVTNELVAKAVNEAYFGNREMLGSEQLAWLKNELASSTATWQVMGSGTLMMNMAIPAELLLNAGDPKVLAKYAAPLQKLAAGQALTPEEQALFSEAGKIPYNLDAWDGYGAEREEIIKAALQLGKKLVNLAGDTHNAWAGILDSMTDAKVAGIELATPGVSSPGFEKYFPGVTGLDSVFEAYTKDLRYANLQDRGFLDLNISKTQINAGFEYLKGTDPSTNQAIWERDTLITTNNSFKELPGFNIPLLTAKVPGLKISEIFTIGESISSYIPTGTPDGMGAYLKDANTIRLLVQSEITKTSGYAYKLANGTELTGARIHYLDIDKTSSQVIGAGLAYSKVVDRAGKDVTAATQISGDASGSAGFDR
ncbi:MAG: hypothetical protein EBU75_10130, partial [Betaproteobacteria bacterium]|nr:hypothetical protein [Betaproteobacteria bacterium]